MQQKKIPTRKCVLCNNQYPKKELLRIVRTPEGDVCLDITGKKSGRGAYICKNSSCLLSAKKSKKLERALEVEIPEGVYKEVSDFANE